MTRTCIIISPQFPPSTVAGVHRARHLAKHLPAAGWEPIVLCVDEAYHEERLDLALAQLVPNNVEVVKVPAVPPRICRPFGLGEISLRGFVPLWRALFNLLRERNIDVVLITGSPYYPMLFASQIDRRFDVPVVLDFQDPWVSAWGSTLPRLSKGGLSYAMATLLEPHVLRGASYITSVSEVQNNQLAERYRWIDPSRMAAIPIGSDSEEFDVLRRNRSKFASVEISSEKINFSYVGTYMSSFKPLMEIVLESLFQLRQEEPKLAERIRFNFIGTSSQTNEHPNLQIMPLAQEAGVGDLIYEFPRRIPYLDALSVLARSDVILMVGTDEPHYTASKIYPGLMSGQPYLSFFHAESSAHKILESAGGGVSLSFQHTHELPFLIPNIAKAIQELATAPTDQFCADHSSYAAYEAATIAKSYACIFEKLALERGI